MAIAHVLQCLTRLRDQVELVPVEAGWRVSSLVTTARAPLPVPCAARARSPAAGEPLTAASRPPNLAWRADGGLVRFR